MRADPAQSAAPRVVLELSEWDRREPRETPALRGLSLATDPGARRLAEALRGRVDIREGYDGLEIATTSFVGQIEVGPLRVVIAPKLPALPLASLLRYAYGLRDVARIEETQSPTERYGFQDLLIALLAAECEELVHRGLARRYEPTADWLTSPRGKLLVDRIVGRGGVREAKLPCRHFERTTDWHLNRVLRSGLEITARQASDRELRRHVHQLSALFRGVTADDRLRLRDVDLAERGLTRMTIASQPALTLIRLLLEAQGIDFDRSQPQSRVPGFLFDMNLFFQRLLSRFLRENLESARIVDEVAIRELFSYSAATNQRRRSVPRPRPDYTMFKAGSLRAFLDAKYRDLWKESLPAEWLYQLSIYAYASPSQVSVLLYASMHENAEDEYVEVRSPIAWSSKTSPVVIVRPVPVGYLARLVAPENLSRSAVARRALADRLTELPGGTAEVVAA